MKTIRVFPRRTRATPDDPLAYVGKPDMFAFQHEPDEIHISVAFTYDLPEAEKLANDWAILGVPVRIGGPATGMRGEDFEAGKYLKRGYVITSRGCPNHCWFCSVPKREGDIRELPITDGWNVLDDNLLACSEGHIRNVFSMLMCQPERAQFTGGLEAARLTGWQVNLLADLKPKTLFFAYDTPDDLEPLRVASKALFTAGFTWASHALRCYCLIGYPQDTIANADKRLRAALDAGYLPMAMLWRGEDGKTNHDWREFRYAWADPACVARKEANP